MFVVSTSTVFGLLGAAFKVGAYLALQLGYIRGQGYYYAGLNAVGALLVLASLAEAFNLSTAVIQIIFITVSVVGIIRYYILTRMSRLTPEEQAFVEATMPGLGRIEARRLMNLASWGNGEPGMQLTVQGEKNTCLYYMMSGKAAVRSDDRVVAKLGDHTFVGDMSLVTGDVASATVELVEPARYLWFPIESLNALLRKDGEIWRHLKAALSGQLVDKLILSNRELARSGMGPEAAS